MAADGENVSAGHGCVRPAEYHVVHPGARDPGGLEAEHEGLGVFSALIDESISLWEEDPACLPRFEHTFTVNDQASREAQLDQFLKSVEAELRHLPRTRSERQRVRRRITSAFERFAKSALDLEDKHLELLLKDGFSTVATQLARQARRFDPAVSIADILQASRNAWTAGGLQMLFGQDMRLTPSIFAYSLLYPYTDNYLDDPATPREAKLGFSDRFRRRLAGDRVAPTNEREVSVWRLVNLIEDQYPRTDWPQVFASLLAIHRAQENSLRFLRLEPSADEVDVVRLSFEKGGTSVLADGYLVAGSLSHEDAQFIFDWGVLLQLVDDLQDLQRDLSEGVLTVFTQAVRHQPLDELTTRTLCFGQRVMDRLVQMPEGSVVLREMIQKSSWSLLIWAAGESGDLYTQKYLAELETHSPFRLRSLGKRRKQLARWTGPLARLFESFLEGDEDEPAFPLLASSFLPRL
jgi:hypothetical protein